MRRARVLLCQRAGWAGGLGWAGPALLLSALTFAVLLPLCCQRLLYSYYFLRSVYLDALSEQALQRSLEAGRDALRYWQAAAPAAPAATAPTAATLRPELLVTVVTSRRSEGRDFHYLLQVMRRLRGLLGGCGRSPCAQVLLCDVDGGPQENPDVALLEPHFPVVRRPPEERRRRRQERVNTFEREKRDYVFCLRRGGRLRPRHLLVLEDDAVPTPDFFAVVRDLLTRRFALRTLYVKLYHPERLQRYWNPEPYRILEWVGLGLVGATLLLLLLPHWHRCSFSLSYAHLLFFTLYFMAAAELVGRHYLLELRRLSPQLYAVSPATECCTPAMLFPGNSSLRAAQYLDAAVCAKGNAKDTVLYQLARTLPGEAAHSVEPNLITHIGAFSSVRANPPRPRLL